MKRVINGKTYNPECSTLLGSKPLGKEGILKLFRTRTGHHFVLQADEPYTCPVTLSPRLRDTLTPISAERAGRWLETLSVVAGPSISTTLTLRLDSGTKDDLIRRANRAGVSLNALCVEALTKLSQG